MDKVTDETLDIWFPTMKDKNKIKKPKNLPLGKSIYDEEDDDDYLGIKHTHKVKSELDALTDDKYNKSSSSKKEEHQPERKSRKDRTPEEDEEILDLMYPSMRHLGKDKINQTNNEKSEKDSKNGHLTGGAADVKQSQNNTMKVPESANKESSNVLNKKKETVSNSAKSEKSEDERNRDALKILGMDENEYQIKANTISRKEKPKDYEIINNVKYPRNSENEKVENLKDLAKKDRSERLKEDNTEYLKRHAKLEQFGVDHVDNPVVKLGDKLASWTNEAVENLHMSKTDSFLNTDYAKKNKVMNSYKEEPEYLHEYYQKKIPSQGGNEDKMPGILFDSEHSKKLKDKMLDDSRFIGKIKKYDNALKSGFSVNDSMDFEDKNWHNAIGKSDIVNMHINKKGDVELDVVDVYDFNEGESNKMVRIGRDRQDKGEIKPYFQRYHVIISKDEYNKMMKK